MRQFYLAFISIFFVNAGFAQIEIKLEPNLLSGSDSLWIDVRMSSASDTLETPINSYQFVVSSSANATFIASDSAYSLSGRKGWTSGENAANGRVGGFSSSIDAIHRIGVLIRLQFLLKSTDTPIIIELHDFKLNTGKPDHFPIIPSLQLNLPDHQE